MMISEVLLSFLLLCSILFLEQETNNNKVLILAIEQTQSSELITEKLREIDRIQPLSSAGRVLKKIEEIRERKRLENN